MVRVVCSGFGEQGFGLMDLGSVPQWPGLFDSEAGAAPSLEGVAPRVFVKGVQHRLTRGKIREWTRKRDPCGRIGAECERGVLGMG